jgi:hypothetical protein
MKNLLLLLAFISSLLSCSKKPAEEIPVAEMTTLI